MQRFLTSLMAVLLGIALIFSFGCSNSNLLTTNKEDTITQEISPEDLLEAPKKALGYNYPSSGLFSPYQMSSWGTATWGLGANMVYNSSTRYYYFEFGVYAPNATKVLLEIYGASITYKTGYNAKYDYWMAKGSDGIWRAKIRCSSTSTYLYGYRCWGPNWPYNSSWTRGNSAAGFISDVDSAGNRFNPNKVLIDPYAKEITHDKETPEMIGAGYDGNIYGTGGTLYKNVPRRNWDTGKWAPKSVAFAQPSPSYGTKPGIAQKNSIIYEAHVRGLTKHSSAANLQAILNGMSEFSSVVSIPSKYLGTYKGASYMAKYLKALGYTTIELLPVQETANDNNPSTYSGGNYWGYMTYGYFAPDRRYAYDKSLGGPTKEFIAMVKAFHDAKMEVYLDVVYNHTGEGGTWNNDYNTRELTCFSGFANNEYYRLTSDNKWYYEGTTGCGNQLNCTSNVTRNLIKDSLVYWITKMGVDGFRFDLAPVIARKAPNYYFDPNNQAVVTDITNLITTYNVEMIAEAWDCEGSFVSGFPPKWGDWNGDYRDVVRKFVKGDGYKPGTWYSFGDVFHGTYNGYYDGGQGGPHKSVNFLVAHDGFTLTDLVSYNYKNNSVGWPFGPSDGGNSDNNSWDCGGNQALRRQQLRNFWTIQMFSRGVPMTVYGDEFGRTQNGNNNPYNVDGLGTYNNYYMINTDSPNAVDGGYHNNLGTDSCPDGKNNIFMFAKYVLSVRKSCPALKQDNYNMPIYYRKNDGVGNLTNSDRAVWIKIQGTSVGSTDFLLFINTWTGDVNFTVPAPATGKSWKRIIDTQSYFESNNNYWTLSSAATISNSYTVKPRSVVVLQQN